MDFIFDEALKVRSVMSKRIVSCPPTATLDIIVEIMVQKKIRSVVIRDGKGPAQGIVTTKDILRNIERKGPKALGLIAERVMSSPLVECTPGDFVETAVDIMNSNDITRLVVVEDGKLVGFLSEKDILHTIPILVRQRFMVNHPASAGDLSLSVMKGNPRKTEEYHRPIPKVEDTTTKSDRGSSDGSMFASAFPGSKEEADRTMPAREDGFSWTCDVCGKEVEEPTIVGKQLLCRSCSSFGKGFI